MALPELIFITNRHVIDDPITVIQNTPYPILVIIRDYDHPQRPKYAASIAAACINRQYPFLIAGDEALALQLSAHGIHAHQHMQNNHTIAQLRDKHPQWIITASCHHDSDINAINKLPVDAILLSPLFSTKSHPKTPPLGIDKFNRLSQQIQHPVYALGGIDTAKNQPLNQLHASGIAGISCYCSFLLQ
tara:strand:- start:408 stop:974 length:567 start_codon:yes stop_codon:yes gene_type:complete